MSHLTVVPTAAASTIASPSLTDLVMASSERAIQALLKDRVLLAIHEDGIDPQDLSPLKDPQRYTDIHLARRALADIAKLRKARGNLRLV